MNESAPRAGLRTAINAFSKSVVIALLVLVGASLVSLQVLRVNGPLYDRIVLGKDLIADILPPPEYVIEAYLETTLALNDPSSVAAHAERLKALKADYDLRQAFWNDAPLTQDLKQQILVATHKPADRFWTETTSRFLPALEAGDMAGARASYGELSRFYGQHRAAVDALVADTNAENLKSERIAIAALAVFAILVVAVAAGLILQVRRRAAAIVRDVIDPLGDMTQTMIKLSSGDLDAEIPHADRTDEIGDMAQALAVFKVQGREGERLRAEKEAARARTDAEQRSAEDLRTQALQSMATRVERETRDAVKTVAGAMRTMAVKANEMARSAGAVDASSAEVANAANDTLSRTKSVSATAKELDGSIRNITAQVEQARSAAGDVVRAAGEAETTIGRLSQAVEQIGRVTGLISDIARQTNLLALNASVEAARAGSAGKGFAVVAGEVKSLAEQTANATADIRDLIGGVQHSAEGTITAVRGITQQVQGMDEASVAIAAAVEQQAEATMAIAASIADTNTMAERMAAKIREVSAEARSAGDISREVDGLTDQVAAEIEGLSTTLVRVVRTSTAEVERRRRPRYAVCLPVELSVGAQAQTGEIRNISDGGAMISGVAASAGSRASLRLSALTKTLDAEVLGTEHGMVHVKFRPTAEQAEQLSNLMETISVSAGKATVGPAGRANAA